MAILINNVTTTAVGNELGTSSRNVGVLCSHPNIFMWSPKKPYSLIAPANAEMSGGSFPRVHGLWRLQNGDVVYKGPSGGASDPYRLGDFRGYSSLGSPSCRAYIYNSVGGIELIQGFDMDITISFGQGVISPTQITDKTNPTKLTMGEGYGGIAIAPRNSPVGYEVAPNDVFSADLTEHVVSINSDLFDCYYVERRIEGTYNIIGGTAPYRIEDLSYRDVITIVPFNVAIGTPLITWVDYGDELVLLSETLYGPTLRVACSFTNNATAIRSFTIEMEATLTNINGNHNVSPSDGGLTLDPGEIGQHFRDLTTASVTQGENTVSGNIRIYYQGNLVGGPKSFSRTFTASIPV